MGGEGEGERNVWKLKNNQGNAAGPVGENRVNNRKPVAKVNSRVYLRMEFV